VPVALEVGDDFIIGEDVLEASIAAAKLIGNESLQDGRAIIGEGTPPLEVTCLLLGTSNASSPTFMNLLSSIIPYTFNHLSTALPPGEGTTHHMAGCAVRGLLNTLSYFRV